jgi:aryl-alcohol dehydrogenase-like predicted oxidoreductase
MRYVKLGSTGLDVSAVCLGCMSFGTPGPGAQQWRIDEETSRPLIKQALDAGINFLDTANVYSRGASEVAVGKALNRNGKRDAIVLATKVHMPMDEDPNASGNHRRHIIEQCEASLKRLGVDHVDLYQIHRPSSQVPIDETLRALDDLIRAGKIRYAGCSNYSGWQLMKALSISDRLGIQRYISQQINYSLLARDAEHELVPAGLDQRTGIMAWSPLQFGLLSGKFRRGQTKPSESRLNSLDAPGTIDDERLYRIVDALADIAGQREVSISQVALNWVMRKPGVDTVIIGARNEQQLRDNLSAASWTLTNAEVERLDEVSALPLPYPNWHQQKFAGDRNPPARHVR